MTEVTRDLSTLLDHTGNGLMVGGDCDGVRYVLTDDWPGVPFWQPQGHVTAFGDTDDLLAYAERLGGRVAAVLPEGAPEPPVGSVVRFVFSDSQGAPQTRTSTGWCWIEGDRQYGDAKTWAERQEFAGRVQATEELLALPVVAPTECKESAVSFHSGAEMESPRHCCDMMRENAEPACEQHPTGFDCADQLLHHNRFGEYGLIIHDGGESYVVIQFCPWCGERLPESKRDAVLAAEERSAQ